MEAVRYHEPVDPDGLVVDEIDYPTPDKDEVLIEIQAASINPVDAKRRKRGAGDLPKITGSDFAGIVESVGSCVEKYENSDRVFGTGLHADRFKSGSFTEYVTVPIDIIAPLPDNVTFRQGAAMALTGVTAWRAVVNHGQLNPAEACFVHGGNGGVGHMAVQLADLAGDYTVATANPKYHDAVHDLGADKVIDYSSDDLTEAAINALENKADVVLDHMVDNYFQFDIDIADFKGRIIIFGGNEAPSINALIPRKKELSIHWMSMSNIVNQKDDLPPLNTILTDLSFLMKREKVSPKIHRIYDFDDAQQMHYDVMNESFLGKLIFCP